MAHGTPVNPHRERAGVSGRGSTSAGPGFTQGTPIVGRPISPIVEGGQVGPEPRLADFGGDFQAFNDAFDEFELAGGGGGKRAPWEEYVIDIVNFEIGNAAKFLNIDPDPYFTWFASHQTEMLNGITPSAGFFRENPQLLTVEHLNGFAQMGVWWLRGQQPHLADGLGKEPFKKGGGGGRRGPTASEIRASFDVDELSRGVTQLWNAWLMEEPKDAVGIAKAYVEAIVRNPEQKLDFKSFVLREIEGTAKYAVLAKNKPTHQPYEDFIGPLMAQASSFLGGGEGTQVGDLVGDAAQLASSPDAFAQRLGKERQITGSAPFLQSMEAQLRAVKGVFKNA